MTSRMRRFPLPAAVVFHRGDGTASVEGLFHDASVELFP